MNLMNEGVLPPNELDDRDERREESEAQGTETTADIIAWIRKPREGENAYLTLWRDEIADRLEAAHRRERGNAAKLREALIKARSAIPPRNCDIYSHDEALNIWAAENENERNGCFDEWLYHEATEKEGGAK